MIFSKEKVQTSLVVIFLLIFNLCSEAVWDLEMIQMLYSESSPQLLEFHIVATSLDFSSAEQMSQKPLFPAASITI